MSTLPEAISGGIIRALSPLELAVSDPAEAEILLLRMGWRSSIQASVANALKAAFGLSQLLPQARQLAAAASASEELDLETIKSLVNITKNLVEKVVGVGQNVSGITVAPFNRPGFWDAFVPDLFNDLIVTRLQLDAPPAYALLVATGIVRHEDYVPTTSDPAERIRYEKKVVDWPAMVTLVSDPGGHFSTRYGWGGTLKGDGKPLLDALMRATLALGVPSRAQQVSKPLGRYFAGSSAPSTARELVLPFVDQSTQVVENTAAIAGYIEIGLLLLPVPPSATSTSQAPNGLVLTTLARGSVAAGIGLTDSIRLKLSGAFDATGALAVEIHPTSTSLFGSLATAFEAEVRLEGRPADPWIVLGDARSHHVAVGGFLVSIRVAGTLTDPELVITAGTGDTEPPPKVAVIVQFGEGDSFLQKLFGTEPQRFEFGGLISWSSKTGLRVQGEAGITFVIPLNKTIGPVELDSLTVALLGSTTGAELIIALTGNAAIGPVAASAERVGVKLTLTPRDKAQPPGPFGYLDLGFGFKSPDGLGLVVDAGPIAGGGFLSIDQANGRYAGILQLEAVGIGITAIGLLDTKLPGGVKGFSFLIIITAKFPPIQLGFGFTLTGIGGLAGIHRTVLPAVLGDGVRTGSVDHILFPENPIRDAPQIISDLRTIFPPMTDRFVFGPMASLGWGSPTIVEAELGIIIQLPNPIVLILLGQINAWLPDKSAAVVELHIDIAGSIDFGAREIRMDSTIHDSRILAFNLSGDMAFRLSWGDPPNFALAVGGWHPQFQPPPGIPALRRLTLALGAGENPRLTFMAYMAVTANSFQIGARGEIYAEAFGFSINGYVSFDALFIFSPFSFLTDITAGIALRRGSTLIAAVTLDAHLTGPAPWHVWGQASASVLFFEVSVSFDATFGEALLVEAVAGNPWDALRNALEDGRNWNASLPPAAQQVVTIAAPDTDPVPVLIDPVGGLTVREKAVPLHRTLSKFGEAALASPMRFDVATVRIGTVPASSWVAVQEYFAPGPFEPMTDSEKLTRSSFERMDAGLSLSSDDLTFGSSFDVKGVDATYETVTIDAQGEPPKTVGTYTLSNAHVLAVAAGGAAGRSPLGMTGNDHFGPLPGSKPAVGLDDEGWVVIATENFSERKDVLAAAATKGEAHHALNIWLAAHPQDRGLLEVAPRHEMVVS